MYTKKALNKVHMLLLEFNRFVSRFGAGGFISDYIGFVTFMQKRKNKSFADGLLAVDDATYTLYDKVRHSTRCPGRDCKLT